MAAPKAGGEPAQNAGRSVFTVKCDSRGAWKIARLVANSDDSPTNTACTGRLGLGAFFGVVPELWQFSVSSVVSPQPPVTQAVGRQAQKR